MTERRLEISGPHFLDTFHFLYGYVRGYSSPSPPSTILNVPSSIPLPRPRNILSTGRVNIVAIVQRWGLLI